MNKLMTLAMLLGLASCVESTSGGGGGGTGGTGGATPVPCTDCLAEAVSWGPNGGFVAYTEDSSLSECRKYTYTRMPAGDPMPMKTCSVDLGGCDAGPLSVHDVEKALAHPDVVAAFAASIPLYGTDPRPCDGTVLQINVGSETVLVGGDCGSGVSCGQSTCIAVPPGLRALANLLRQIDDQQIKLGECAQVFP